MYYSILATAIIVTFIVNTNEIKLFRYMLIIMTIMNLAIDSKTIRQCYNWFIISLTMGNLGCWLIDTKNLTDGLIWFALRLNPKSISFVHNPTRDMIKHAIIYVPDYILKIPKKMRKLDLIMLAIQSNPQLIINFCKHRKSTINMFYAAVRADGKLLKYVPKKYITSMMCIRARETWDFNVSDIARKQWNCALIYNSIDSHPEQLNFILTKNFPVTSKMFETAYFRVESSQKLYILSLIPDTKKTLRVWKDIVHCGYVSLQNVPQKYMTRDICLISYKKDFRNIKYIPINLLSEYIYKEEYNRSTGSMMKYGAIHGMSPHHMTYKMIVTCAMYDKQFIVKCLYCLTQYMCERLLNDHAGFNESSRNAMFKKYGGLSHAWIRKDPSNIKYFTMDICENSSLVYYAITIDPSSIKYVCYTLMNKYVVKYAIEYDPAVIEFIPSYFMTDEFRNIIYKNPSRTSLRYIPMEMLSHSYCKKCVYYHPMSIEFIPRKYMNWKLIKTALQKCNTSDTDKIFQFVKNKLSGIQVYINFMNRGLCTLHDVPNNLMIDHGYKILTSISWVRYVGPLTDIKHEWITKSIVLDAILLKKSKLCEHLKYSVPELFESHIQEYKICGLID